ncbi:MAG TPA: V-type ATP synthase subunit E [Sediminispirochaeta sp.]|nr:V-type ATP synthase subunit E [Sediminispirochaeta sp.]
MDVQLKELIDRIKSEGIQNAEQESEKIIKEAQEKAKKIVSDAEQEADRLKKEAEEEVRRMEYTGRESLKQAGRDLLLSLEKRLQSVFDSVIYTATAEQMKGDTLRTFIQKLLDNWDEDVSQVELLLPEKELEQLDKGLRDKLSAQLAQGMEIKPLSGVEAGFQLAYKDGSAYYNFSAEGIAEILSAFLNPKLAEILKEAARKEE